MFKRGVGSQRQIRRAVGGGSSDEENAERDVKPTAVKPIPATGSSASLLSFDVEDASGDEFVARKKQSSTHKLDLERSRRHLERDKAKRKKHQRLKARDLQKSPTPEKAADVKPVFRLSPKREDTKPSIEEIESVLSGTAAEDTSVDESDEFKKHIMRRGPIPDSSAIYQARLQRQRAREEGSYIALDDTQRFKDDGSRLIREDENDLSDADSDHGAVLSSKSAHNNGLEKALAVAEAESGSPVGSDFEDWEREQLKKAVSSHQINSLIQDSTSTAQYSQSGSAYGTYGSVHDGRPVAQLAVSSAALPKLGGGAVVVPKPKSMTLKEIRKQMADSIANLDKNVQHEADEQECDSKTLEQNEHAILRMRAQAEHLRDKYSAIQRLKLFCQDALECWSEKMPRLECYEASILRLWSDRLDSLSSRRRQDVQDEYQTVVDGSSDSTGSERNLRISRRDVRRNTRRKLREKQRLLSLVEKKEVPEHREGWSTDEEEDEGSQMTRDVKIAEVHAQIRENFSDVSPDFTDLGTFVGHFDDAFMDTALRQAFTDAFVVACLPRLLAPLVRRDLALSLWNPVLDEDSAQLSSQPWFLPLASFGSQLPDTNLFNNLDPSDDPRCCLLPLVVDKVVLPRFAECVKASYEPCSTRSTKRIVDFLQVLTLYPTINQSSKRLQAVLNAVHDRLLKCINDDLFVPMYPKSVDAYAAQSIAFADRQFWFTVKIFRNVLDFHQFFDSFRIVSEAVDSICNRYLVLALHSCCGPVNRTAAKAKAVVDAIPANCVGMLSQRQLSSLSEFIAQLAAKVQQDGKTTKSDRASLLDIASMLRKLNRSDLVEQVKAFSQ